MGDRGDRRADILRVIALDGPIARTHIADRLGVSGATVTAVTRDLLESGLVRVSHKVSAAGGRGRPQELLTIESAAAVVLGAKLTADRVRGVAVDLTGEVVARFEEPFDALATSVLDDLGILLTRISATWAQRLVGVGLGVPGTVSADGSSLVTSPMLGWERLPIADRVAEQLSVPVIVDNDVNTLVTGQRLYGVGRGVEDFLTVTIGRGIGLGIVMDGAVRRGRGGAGELGHTRQDPTGPRCDCGRRGCLETRISEPAVLRNAVVADLLPAGGTIGQLRVLARAGGPAQTLLTDAARQLGAAVADLVNVLGPRLVVVSGEGVVAWDLWAAGFDAALADGLLPFHTDVEVLVDPWEDDTWGRGAAALVLDSFFGSTPGTHEDDVVGSHLQALLDGGQTQDVLDDGQPQGART